MNAATLPLNGEIAFIDGQIFIVLHLEHLPVMKKSMAAASTVAYVMQEKFQKGVPLYRQEEYWKGQGIDLRRNTMANWIIRSSKWFVPLWNAFREELLKCDIVNADETRCHVLKEDGREAKQMSEMWVFCSPEKNIALYQYKPSRGGKVAKEMLKGFSGRPTAIRRTTLSNLWSELDAGLMQDANGWIALRARNLLKEANPKRLLRMWKRFLP